MRASAYDALGCGAGLSRVIIHTYIQARMLADRTEETQLNELHQPQAERERDKERYMLTHQCPRGIVFDQTNIISCKRTHICTYTHSHTHTQTYVHLHATSNTPAPAGSIFVLTGAPVLCRLLSSLSSLRHISHPPTLSEEPPEVLDTQAHGYKRRCVD
eukprot:GHVU01166122.1.p1 GENE.GHVU01166122.1~~GHVU01166122.1.p1  ORF type:complete len:159 (+),score=1.61 GHVU01166122.1:180-656(+)